MSSARQEGDDDRSGGVSRVPVEAGSALRSEDRGGSWRQAEARGSAGGRLGRGGIGWGKEGRKDKGDVRRRRRRRRRRKERESALTLIRLALDEREGLPGLVERVVDAGRHDPLERPPLRRWLARGRAAGTDDDGGGEKRVAEPKEGPDELDPGRGEERGGGGRQSVMEVPVGGGRRLVRQRPCMSTR